jgi:6-pyruvoyltetrahydropterin/6-carboxytetrahydropterin synthase
MAALLSYVASAGFEAARQVRILPDQHRSRRMHGHSFAVRIRTSLPHVSSVFPGLQTDHLAETLRHSVAPLDYDLLNNHLDVPTDENLARWIRRALGLPELEVVGIQSTYNQGIHLDRDDHAHVWRRFRFEAAHRLPNVRPGHKCGRMHGHGFEVILHADQDLGQRDMGVDFDTLGEYWEPVQVKLNHNCLNDVPGLENPTSEMLAAWVWENLKTALPELSWVSIYETTNAGCHYDGNTTLIASGRTNRLKVPCD